MQDNKEIPMLERDQKEHARKLKACDAYKAECLGQESTYTSLLYELNNSLEEDDIAKENYLIIADVCQRCSLQFSSQDYFHQLFAIFEYLFSASNSANHQPSLYIKKLAELLSALRFTHFDELTIKTLRKLTTFFLAEYATAEFPNITVQTYLNTIAATTDLAAIQQMLAEPMEIEMIKMISPNKRSGSVLAPDSPVFIHQSPSRLTHDHSNDPSKRYKQDPEKMASPACKKK